MMREESTNYGRKFRELCSQISVANTENEGKLRSILLKYTEIALMLEMSYKHYENNDRAYFDLITNSYCTALNLAYEARLLELERRTTGWWHFRKRKAMKLAIRNKRSEEQHWLNRAREILGAWAKNNSLSTYNL